MIGWRKLARKRSTPIRKVELNAPLLVRCIDRSRRDDHHRAAARCSGRYPAESSRAASASRVAALSTDEPALNLTRRALRLLSRAEASESHQDAIQRRWMGVGQR